MQAVLGHMSRERWYIYGREKETKGGGINGYLFVLGWLYMLLIMSPHKLVGYSIVLYCE